MSKKGALPSICPECKKEVNWLWQHVNFTDSGSKQNAICPECKTVFVEYSEAVDYEKVSVKKN